MQICRVKALKQAGSGVLEWGDGCSWPVNQLAYERRSRNTSKLCWCGGWALSFPLLLFCIPWYLFHCLSLSFALSLNCQLPILMPWIQTSSIALSVLSFYFQSFYFPPFSSLLKAYLSLLFLLFPLWYNSFSFTPSVPLVFSPPLYHRVSLPLLLVSLVALFFSFYLRLFQPATLWCNCPHSSFVPTQLQHKTLCFSLCLSVLCSLCVYVCELPGNLLMNLRGLSQCVSVSTGQSTAAGNAFVCIFPPSALKASERRRKGEFLRGTHGWGGCVLVSVCVRTCVSALHFD